MEKAYKNLEFLNSADARSLRILAEYLEPQARFGRYNVTDTVVFFGSARAIPGDVAKRQLEAAEKAGMKRGDVIIAVDGKPVQRVGQLQRMIAAYEPGAAVKVKAIRYGQELTFDVKLAEANVQIGRAHV